MSVVKKTSLLAMVFSSGFATAGSGITININEPAKKPPINVNIQVGTPAANQAPAKKKGFYVCKVSAFTDSYAETGSSKTEAKFKVQKACTAKHNAMHCDDVECEGEEAADDSGWICKVSAFTKEYEAFAPTKAEATFKVTKECTASNHAMHCDDVTCSQ